MIAVTIFKRCLNVGLTENCRINGVPARVTWRDDGHLVIGPDDTWPILGLIVEDDRVHFICSNDTQR